MNQEKCKKCTVFWGIIQILLLIKSYKSSIFNKTYFAVECWQFVKKYMLVKNKTDWSQLGTQNLSTILRKSKIKVYKTIVFLNLLITVNPNVLFAQKEYIITIPSTKTTAAGSSGVDPSEIISYISETLSIYANASCLEKINLQKDSAMRVEMKKITSEKQYSLVLSFRECKFIALFPEEETGKWKNGIWLDPSWVIFHINLYPDISPLINSLVVPSPKNEEDLAKKPPLLATYQDQNGRWVVLHPYGLSESYPTEKQALESVFYTESDFKFLCKRGKYIIYELTMRGGPFRQNVRQLLNSFGISDIP